MLRNLLLPTVFAVLVFDFAIPILPVGTTSPLPTKTVAVDPFQNQGKWQGWGSSLAWWARAIGGTANADDYADLIYTTNSNHDYPV